MNFAVDSRILSVFLTHGLVIVSFLIAGEADWQNINVFANFI